MKSVKIEDRSAFYAGVAPIRTGQIDRVTVHSLQSGETTLARIDEFFRKRIASGHSSSVNYAIDDKGNIGLFVPEDRRAWTSSSRANDDRAITIECATTARPPYTLYEPTRAALIGLLTDLCQRYGKKKIVKITREQAKAGYAEAERFTLTEHNYFADTDCPGPDIQAKLPGIVDEINRQLCAGEVLYRVQIGAYTVKENAEKAKAKVKGAYIEREEDGWHVYAGAYVFKKYAEKKVCSLKERGIAAVIKEYPE